MFAENQRLLQSNILWFLFILTALPVFQILFCFSEVKAEEECKRQICAIANKLLIGSLGSFLNNITIKQRVKAFHFCVQNLELVRLLSIAAKL